MTSTAAARDVTQVAHRVAADVQEVAEDIHEGRFRRPPPEDDRG